MCPFNRLQELPTIRLLQLEGVTVARRPESIHFSVENAGFCCCLFTYQLRTSGT